jgi:hypothetical protein
MQSPYTDRLTVEDIACLRGCGQQWVRCLISQLKIKPIERLGNTCIYSADDSQRLINLPHDAGRPKLHSSEDCLNAALTLMGKSWAEVAPSILADSGMFGYLDMIEAWPELPKPNGQKFRHVWSPGMKRSAPSKRPAWNQGNAEIVRDLIIGNLTK